MTTQDTSGHRQRLRDRFLAGDEAAVTDEALLELLLTYAIPQKDVKPLARDLIHRFGSLGGILEAKPDVLSAITGLKSSSVALLKLVDAIRSLHPAPSQNKTRRKTVRWRYAPRVEGCASM